MPFLGKVPSQIVDSDVDIDGGTIDGATIGSITAGAGTFTNLSATGTITFPDDGISGDDINGGTISNFTSTGIDDNATSTAVTLDASGNVTVGGTTAGNAGSVNLSVGSPGSTAGGLQLWAGASGSHFMQFGDVASGDGYYRGAIGYLHASDSLVAYSAGAERMRIDSSGNLLVGKTTDPTVGIGQYIKPTGETFHTVNNSYNTLHVYNVDASAFRFYVGQNGTVHATNTSISAISDASLKENVRDLDKGLDAVLALQPRRFDWKNGDGNDIMGFIAQEVEEVMPELIDEAQYNKDETKKSLKMGDMIPSMVKAIQEQQAMIEDLKAEVAALKGA